MLLLLLVAAPGVLANGGTVQVAGQVAGPYAITVTTSPNPPRVGEIDVSVLLQQAGTENLIQDARILVTAEPVGHDAPTVEHEATKDQATNKLYFAAVFDIPEPGAWRIQVQVAGPVGEGRVEFPLEVTQASLLDQPLLLVAFAAVPVILAAWWWSRSQRTASRRPR